MPKVLVIVPVPLDEAGLERRRQQALVASPGPEIEFVYRPVKVGPEGFISDHDFLLADMACFEAGMRAEEEGFSAVCMDTVTDSGMDALRSVLDIPVVGPGLASYMMALTLGRRFSVLTIWKEYQAIYDMTLRKYGLADRCASVRSVDMDPEVYAAVLETLLDGNEDTVFPLLVEAGLKCVEDGADVICIGSTTMHQAGSYLSENLPVPVINPGPLSYKLIEAMLALKLSQSRRAYPRPFSPMWAAIQGMLDGARETQREEPS